ncbi:hypothetical protein ACHHYP_13117 [Achlya hypogyna]|uniref:Uncharacterized protein n=1 Tax=Achlya hypogyna TaxID=1202772 RepID=A0A1V9YFY9_ACHHY|nr:hypothetical protein ACHHYP_13117 [Achlya hypogyna]
MPVVVSDTARSEILKDVATEAPSAAREVADMVRYLVFLLLFLVVTVGVGSHADGDLPFRVTEMLNTQLRDKEYLWEDTQVLKRFKDIQTINELHQFLTGPFYEVVYGSDSFDADSTFPEGPTLPGRDTIAGASKIIGLVRIGQVRVQGTSCPGSMAQLSTLYNEPPVCYGDYSADTESSETFGLGANYSALAQRSTEPLFYSLSYNSFPSPLFAEFLPGQESVHCEFETRTHCEVHERLESLRTHKFFDRATRAIFIDMALYDMHIDHVTTVRLFLEHFQGGGLAPQAEFLTYRVYASSTVADSVQSGLSILLLFVAIYQLYWEVSVQPNKAQFLRRPSNLLQLSNYVAFFVVLGLHILSALALPSSIPPNTFVNFRTACTYYGLALNCHSFCCMLSWLKLFKFLSFIPMFGQLTNTVQRSAKQVVELLVVFFMCLLGAALAFTLGFGNLVYTYHSITASFYTLLHIVTGDIVLKELSVANRFVGPFFFMIFLFMMMFVILNIFIVIVSDSYTETKKEMKAKQDMKLDKLSEEIVRHIVHNVLFKLPFIGPRILKPIYQRSKYASAAIVERLSSDTKVPWVTKADDGPAQVDLLAACSDLVTDLESLQHLFVPEIKRKSAEAIAAWEHDAHEFTKFAIESYS